MKSYRTSSLTRRQFGSRLMAGTADVGGAAAPGSLRAAARKTGSRANPLMHVGGEDPSIAGGRQADMTSRANLQYNLRHGVRHLTISVPDRRDGTGWDLENPRRMRDNCDRHMPKHPDDKDAPQAFAFGYGYIQALIQAVNAA